MDKEQRRQRLLEEIARIAKDRGVPEDQVKKELAEMQDCFHIARMDGEDFSWSDYRDEENPLWWVDALAEWAEMFGYSDVRRLCDPYL